MRCYFSIVLLASLSVPTFCAAQTGPPETSSTTAKNPAAASAPTGDNMQPVALGDHWTYEVRDNVTGNMKGQYTQTVTDISPTDVTVQILALGATASSFAVFDPQWNLKNTPIVKYSPNDGTGIKDGIKVSDSWSSKNSDIRASRTVWKRTETSKVLGEEAVTTAAGSFNSIKYETTIDIRGAIDPTKKGHSVLTTWWVPSINHWIKRTEKTVTENHVLNNTTIELVDFGRQ